jgi:hypothetical protein
MTEVKEFDIIRRKNASGKNVVGKDRLPFSPDLHAQKSLARRPCHKVDA